MTEYYRAPDDIIEMAENLINRHHLHLMDCRIALVMRDEAPTSADGRKTFGKASKVMAKYRPYLDYDFLIWLAQDTWDELTPRQQEALLDHELCHCGWDDLKGKPVMRKHDVEEFLCIIQRHGFWDTALQEVEHIYKQAALPGIREGQVGTLDDSDDDVLGQVGSIFDDE